ncbi:MAG TPA: alpha/beta hydrolase [Ramlibacter sp.]|nr:alpha/beta hydrolase [Ramlibacter sp.]
MERPLLLLIPGLLCDEATWTRQVQALDAVARCQVVDHGQRDSIEDMARHVLGQAGSDRFAIAGHSMGGRVALEVVRQAPDRVVGLALLDTGYQPRAPGEAGEQERRQRHALLEIARTRGMRAMGEQWARGMVHPRRVATPLFEEVLTMIERSTPGRFEAQIRALLERPDATRVLDAIRCPTLLVCGRQDAWSPLARHEEMQRAIAASVLEVVEDSGHMSPMEQPQAVSAALAAWLARIRV